MERVHHHHKKRKTANDETEVDIQIPNATTITAKELRTFLISNATEQINRQIKSVIENKEFKSNISVNLGQYLLEDYETCFEQLTKHFQQRGFKTFLNINSDLELIFNITW